MRKESLRDLTVQAKDCYDPSEYILVHQDYYARLKGEYYARTEHEREADWQRLKDFAP